MIKTDDLNEDELPYIKRMKLRIFRIIETYKNEECNENHLAHVITGISEAMDYAEGERFADACYWIVDNFEYKNDVIRQREEILKLIDEFTPELYKDLEKND